MCLKDKDQETWEGKAGLSIVDNFKCDQADCSIPFYSILTRNPMIFQFNKFHVIAKKCDVFNGHSEKLVFMQVGWDILLHKYNMALGIYARWLISPQSAGRPMWWRCRPCARRTAWYLSISTSAGPIYRLVLSRRVRWCAWTWSAGSTTTSGRTMFNVLFYSRIQTIIISASCFYSDLTCISKPKPSCDSLHDELYCGYYEVVHVEGDWSWVLALNLFLWSQLEIGSFNRIVITPTGKGIIHREHQI